MVAIADVNRVAYLSARLEEISRGLALVAAGGGARMVEVANPADPADTVCVIAETPIVVDGLVEALDALTNQLTAELEALGVVL